MSFPGPEDCNCCHGGQPCECCAMHGDDKAMAIRKAAPVMLEALEAMIHTTIHPAKAQEIARAAIKAAKEEN